MGVWRELCEAKINRMEAKGSDVFCGQPPVWFMVSGTTAPMAYRIVLPSWVADEMLVMCAECVADAAVLLGDTNEWGASKIVLPRDFMRSAIIRLILLSEEDRKPARLEYLRRCAVDNAKLISFLHVSR